MIITYLLGAGASANAVPVDSGIKDAIKEIIDSLTTNNNIPESKQILIEDLEWLCEAEKFKSIDMFAKKLFLKNRDSSDEELKRLKLAYSVFLNMRQQEYDNDSRYDNFLVSILQNTISSFPKNIRILTWNYDLQILKSYSKIIGQNIEPWHNQLPMYFKNCTTEFDTNSFGVIHLNGCATFRGWDYPSLGHPLISDKGPLNDSLLEKIINAYIAQRNNNNFCELSFAFEKERKSCDMMKIIEQSTTKTESLVIIGYSFPYFNRTIDKTIINSMPLLKKIYIQDIDTETVEEKLSSFLIKSDIEIKRVSDIKQFYLPNELA